MEFERIGENTVQCHMTVEEMNEYGLHIEDFFTNQEKSREFLERLVEKAEEEIGYEVESGMISMQLMRMPDDSLIITFSDRGEEGLHNMLNQLQNLAGMIDDKSVDSIVDAMANESAASKEMHVEENIEEFHERCKDTKKDGTNNAKEKTTQKHRQEQIKKELEKKNRAAKLYCFSSLSQIEDFALTIQTKKNIPSKVYKDEKEGLWYLLVKKGKLRLDEYQNLCQQALEYGSYCSDKPFVEQYCKEHYRCVISKRAIGVMKEYQTEDASALLGVNE